MRAGVWAVLLGLLLAACTPALHWQKLPPAQCAIERCDVYMGRPENCRCVQPGDLFLDPQGRE